AGRVDTTHPVSGVDVVPTLCDLAGIPPPAGLPGSSWKPFLIGPDTTEAEGHDFVVTELKPFRDAAPDMEARMVRSRDWKYIRFAGCPAEQLLDMRNDPGETTSLHADPRYADVLARHRQGLKEWAVRTGDTPVWQTLSL
ncbi:MAG: hypothetical protein U1E27_11590, partial [Kiritimatiellia bacterium]|nr:hypothetical protein [Kiritimatiellia bacterium]